MEPKTREEYLLRSRDWKLCDKLHDGCTDLSCNVKMKAPCLQSIEPIANTLVDFQRQVVAQERTVDSSDEREEKEFHCSLCGCLYVEPVTLKCGHTLCKTCILPAGKTSVPVIDCKQCGSTSHGTDLSVNVFVAQLIQKWFPCEYEREVKTLEEVSRRESQGHQTSIVQSLSDVLSKSPKHVKALNWRSHAFFQMGLYKNALEDVDLACDLRPFLSSVFRQRGVVLLAMGDYEKATDSFSRALALDPKLDAECRSALLFCLTQKLDFRTADLSEEPLCNRHLECFNQTKLRHSLNLKETTGHPVKRTVLKRESSLKRPIEDSVENSFFCSQDSRLKYFKPSTEHISSFSELCRADAVVRDKEDLECRICYTVLYQPVTTACGHTFCRACLQRGLDYKSECPWCRSSLNCGVERNTNVTTVIEETVEKLFPDEYAEKEKSFLEEKSRWKGVGVDENVEVPIFVCLLAFPSLKYPLHIFEPRYQLMIRRCVELGSRMFGMCAISEDPDKKFADYGTMLYIENVSFLPDGRSIVQTTAGRRFRVVSRSANEGYNTAKVEWLEDEAPKPYSEDPDLQVINVDCYKVLKLWFNLLTPLQQTCVTNAIGPMPAVEELSPSSNGPSWLWWGLAAVPLQDKAKLIILSMTSLAERLQSVRRFLELLTGVGYEN